MHDAHQAHNEMVRGRMGCSQEPVPTGTGQRPHVVGVRVGGRRTQSQYVWAHDGHAAVAQLPS
jgi:hypothetical protein